MKILTLVRIILSFALDLLCGRSSALQVCFVTWFCIFHDVFCVFHNVFDHATYVAPGINELIPPTHALVLELWEGGVGGAFVVLPTCYRQIFSAAQSHSVQ